MQGTEPRYRTTPDVFLLAYKTKEGSISLHSSTNYIQFNHNNYKHNQSQYINPPSINMATAETIHLTASHPPKPESLKSFTAILPALKSHLVYLRHQHDKHEPSYFVAVSSLSDDELTSFDESDLVAVRAGSVAYGVIVFGKVRIPKSEGGFVHVRWFGGGADTDGDGDVEKAYKFHSVYTEEKEWSHGVKTFRAIMEEGDELQFFNE